MGRDSLIQATHEHRISAAALLVRAAGALLVALALAAVVACEAGNEAPPATPPATPAVTPAQPASAQPASAWTPEHTPTPMPEPATPAPEPTPTPVARPVPTDAERCRDTPAAQSRPDCYYDGPLFDAHFHPAEAIPEEAGTPSSAMCDLLERDGVTWGLALYELPPTPQQAEHSARVIAESASCAVTLVQPMYLSAAGPNFHGFRRGDYSRGALAAWLRPEGDLHGVGEIALYFSELHDVRLDHPVMQTVLEAVDEIGGVVMIHPRRPASHHAPAGLYPNPTTAEEIAAAAERYPDTTFVIHGGFVVWDLIMPLFDTHPNLYFSYETVFWFIETQQQIPWSGVTPAQFAQRFDAYGIDRLVARTLPELVRRLEQHPDRVMWGGDRYQAWHFDERVSSRWLEATRMLIARLPEETQGLYAYENALRVFGRFLEPPLRSESNE